MGKSAFCEKMINFMERASWIRKMFEEGARLKQEYGADKVCDFSLGNPDLPPPNEFKTALIEAASSNEPGIHSYMPNAGIPWVRDEIAKQVKKDHEVEISGQEILMTCGAAGGLNIIFKSILNPGDEVIVPKPFFVEYNFYVDNHLGKLVPVDSKSDFSLDINNIKNAITSNTKAILLNSPNNPSGVIYSEDSIKELANLLIEMEKKGQRIFLISDEPYRRLVFSGNSVPPLMTHYRNTIITTSFSKDLSIPGERIGYVAVHPQAEEKDLLLGALTLANRILGYVNAPALMQRVVAKAATANVDVSIYERRRDLFAKILDKAGLEFTLPQGAFYFFPKSPISDETKFVKILQKELILTVPGSGFGQPGYIRIAFCVDDEVIKRSEDGFKRAVDNIS